MLQAASYSTLLELVLGCGNGFWVSGIRGGPEEGGDRESGWWLGLVTWNSRQLGAWSLEPRTWNQLACDSALSVRKRSAVSQAGQATDPTLVTGLLARLPRSGFQEHSALDECVLC